MDSNLKFLQNKISSYESDKNHIIQAMKATTDKEEKQKLSGTLDAVCDELDNYTKLFNMYFRKAS
jgi:hypothetical protein